MVRRDIFGVEFSRYDLILAVIPVAFLAALFVATTLSVSVRSAMAGASTVGAIAVGDAIFRNPPGNPGRVEG